MNRFFKGFPLQKGYGLGGQFRKSVNVQRGGYGLGGLFSKFFKYLSPYIKKAKDFAIPLLKSGANVVGKELVKTSSEIANDLLDGKNVKESAREKISNSYDNLSKMASQKLSGLVNMEGSGSMRGRGKRKITINQFISKKNKKKRSLIKKQKRKPDFFD